jgi:hypothetical protein
MLATPCTTAFSCNNNNNNNKSGLSFVVVPHIPFLARPAPILLLFPLKVFFSVAKSLRWIPILQLRWRITDFYYYY